MLRCGKIIITLILVLCIPMSAFAFEQGNILRIENTYQMDNGDYYTISKDSSEGVWKLSIYVPNNDGTVYLDASLENGDSVYSMTFEKNNYSNQNDSIIAECCARDFFENIELAEKRLIAESRVPTTRSSAVSDIENILTAIHGPKNVNRLLATYKTYSNVDKIQVYENTVFPIDRQGGFSFSAGTTLGFIARVTGFEELDVLAELFGTVETIEDAITTITKTVDVYDASAVVSRYGTVNGNSTAYAMANKITTYVFLNELGNNVRVYMDDSKPTYYVPNENYYTHYKSVADDTYDMYMR